MDIDEIIGQYKKEVDDYTKRLHVAVCFGHTVIFDNEEKIIPRDSFYWLGRRMTTSEDNKQNRNGTVTPDLVIQSNEDYGIVAEIKQGLAKDNDTWEKIRRQLEKYDDKLDGWIRPIQGTHDLVLLVPNYLQVSFNDYLEKSEWSFERKIAYVGYYREESGKTFYVFHRFSGKLSDENLDEKLRIIDRVPMNMVVPYCPLEFCDDQPPLPYTMYKVWLHIASYKEEIEPEDKKKAFVKFTLDQLVSDLKQNNAVWDIDDSRARELPRTSWVRSALDELVKLKYFEKSFNNDGYLISYSKYERLRTPMDDFIRKLSSEKFDKQKKETQLSLLDVK